MIAVLHIKSPQLKTHPDVIQSVDLSSISKPVDTNEEHYMFTFASQLADEGFGTFEDCLTVLTVFKGDVQLAKRQLSKIMFQSKQRKQ